MYLQLLFSLSILSTQIVHPNVSRLQKPSRGIFFFFVQNFTAGITNGNIKMAASRFFFDS